MQNLRSIPIQPALSASFPSVAASSVALPPHRYEQHELADVAGQLLPDLHRSQDFLSRFFTRLGVGARHLALPAEDYAALDDFGSRNRAWLDVATELGERCLTDLFKARDIQPQDVSLLMTTTVTGVAVPSLDARLMNRLPLRDDLKRVPLFGLGCLGGAAGLARASEYVRAFPDQLAVLLSVELCSLTLQRDDASMANVISSGLFGDGAAAVLLAGAEHPLSRGPGQHASHDVRVVDSRAVFFRDTERVMGWDMVDHGFKVVLDRAVPHLVRRELPRAVDAFLADHNLTRDDIAAWVSHPGGPAVLDAMEQSLGLPPEALAASRRSLVEVGNLSSASVLRLLDEYRGELRPEPDSAGLLIAMGPGFCAELVLLQW